MQSSSTSSVAQPEAILDWLQKEMGYRPLGPYMASSKASMPSSDAIRRVCRGNMIPVFNFLLKRVKSVKTVNDIRRNILVHGREDNASGHDSTESSKNGEVGKGTRGARRKEKPKGRIESTNAGDINNRETALQERDSAEKEVERLRRIVRRQRKELKARMLEVSREEADRKRMLDERSNYRHKQVTLEAYNQQCDEAIRIFSQYHKRLSSYVNQAKDSQRLEADSSKQEDTFLNETNKERNISKACEWLAVHITEKIHNSFPAYEGIGIHSNPQQEAAKLGIDVDGDIPDEIQDVIHNCLKSPPQLLLSLITYTQKLKSLIAKETEKIDIKADAETLRYKYENNRVMDASPDASSPLQLQLYGNGNIASKGTQNQLLERQKAHVQQFVATEDQLNKAAEAKSAFQKLQKRLYGSDDEDSFSQNMSSLRQLELEVWAMEREAAGLKASLATLMSEVQRLNMLCEDRKEAEDSLKKKWKKIEEFDSRRSELKFICNTLMKANMDAAAFWSQQPLIAREHASNTIIPECGVVINITNNTKDLIDKEASAFFRIPDNTLYMLPSTPQALLESMIPNGPTGPEAVAIAEKNATLLTARAGAGDPSAIPSISRVSAAFQYPAGVEGSEASLASVLESMEFCLKLRGSEACLLEDLSNAINMVHTKKELVESGHTLLNHAYHTQKEYKGTTNYCLDLASEQMDIVSEKWMPELKNGVSNAQKSLEDCKYVSGLLDEWWEQPASTVVDWVTVDGQNVAAWHNHVKQLLTFYDSELL
ncbi:AUGMIN subunit 5 [Lactuca sativa]|nr:AUGMIN subunit 5 [Lactuca sativa]